MRHRPLAPPLSAVLVALLLAAFALALAACSDDEETSQPPPDMATIWPHADGTLWYYTMEYAEYVAPFSDDTTLPSMETLHARLQSPPGGTPDAQGLYQYAFGFAGTFTAGTGAEVQRITTSILAAPPTAKGINDDPDDPHFLGGMGFAYEDSGYYGYYDHSDRTEWVWLEGDLRAGEEFGLTWVGPRETITLDARVWSVGGRTLDGVRYDQLVEVMYVHDLGVVTYTNEQGEPLAETRVYLYGIVWYSPELGPIAVRERRVVPGRGPVTEQEGLITMDYVLRLEDIDTP